MNRKLERYEQEQKLQLQLQLVEVEDQKARDMLAYQNAMFAAACLAKMPACRGGECGQ